MLHSSSHQPSLHRWRQSLVVTVMAAFMLSIAAPFQAELAGAAIQAPDVTADGVYAFDLATGIELFARNEHERMSIASIVKVVTALVTVNHAELDQQVVIVESDLVDDPAYSNMDLHAGDTLTVSQLLYGLLIPSGSDGAQALARHVGKIISGSDDPAVQLTAFVDEMNLFVAEAGLENTRFTNPDGVDAPNAYSSAYDIAILSGMLMKNEFLASVVGEPGYSFISVGPEARQYQAGSTNHLLGQSGVVGIKTGSTDKAGGCVVLARKVNGGGSIVITSVIGADLTYNGLAIDVDERWNDALRLFQFMDANFVWLPLNDAGTFTNLPTELAVWNVKVPGDISVPVTISDEIRTRYQIALNPDGGGRIDFYFNDDLVGSVPLEAASASRSLSEASSWQGGVL